MKIYALLDFSDYSNTQLKLANQWCINFDYELVIVHEVFLMVPSLGSPEVRLKIEYDQKRGVLNQLETLRQSYVDPSVKVSFEITAEPLIKYLSEGVQIQQGDLIVMGIKGTGKLKQIFLGSTATRVIEELNQITVALPIQLELNLPKKLIVAVHHKTHINEEVLNILLQKIKYDSIELEFVSIITEGEQISDADRYLNELKNRYSEHYTCRINLFAGNDALNDLKNFVLPQNGSFLVLQKGSRSLADRVFRRFMINEMVYDASTPLIILPS